MSETEATPTDKMEQIIRGLAAKAPTLAWETTAEEDVFLVSFQTHSVSLQPGRGLFPTKYWVGVLDSAGRELESYDASESHDAELYEIVRSLYEQAKRAALKVDEGLDAVLKEIEAV